MGRSGWVAAGGSRRVARSWWVAAHGSRWVGGSGLVADGSQDDKETLHGSRKYMLGRPFHIFSALAQAYIFDIRRPMYYFSLIFPYTTIYFLYISYISLHFHIFSYYFLVFLASNIFGCPVVCKHNRLPSDLKVLVGSRLGDLKDDICPTNGGKRLKNIRKYIKN